MKLKKKFMCGLLAVSTIMTLLTGCGKSEDDNTFTVGFDAEYPPYGYMDENGEYTGFDLELAEEVCKINGWELKKQPIAWDNKDNELNSGAIDCIWNGFTITEERLNALTFSDPYVNNAQVAVVRGNSNFNTLKDLAGKKIGVQAGSSAQDAIDDTPDFKKSVKAIVEFKDNLTALMDLEIGGVDAVIMDLLVANDNINRSGKNFRVVEEGLSNEEYGIGFRKADIALRDAVQEMLNEMAKDGSLAKIATKWFGADITVVGKN